MLIDKPQPVSSRQNEVASGQVLDASAIPDGSALADSNQTDKKDLPIPILDQESVAGLVAFFQLLDEWERKEALP